MIRSRFVRSFTLVLATFVALSCSDYSPTAPIAAPTQAQNGLLSGLLGTVTGMMRTFGSMGGGDIGAAAGQITGGVAEALIATAAGLAIAITALLPYNYINARTEEAKHEVADASNALEILIKKSESFSS